MHASFLRKHNAIWKKNLPCWFLAVNIIIPVSSPTKHSAIRIWRIWGPSGRPFCMINLELTTFTISVCPAVPGRSCSTLVNTGFLIIGLATPAIPTKKKIKENQKIDKNNRLDRTKIMTQNTIPELIQKSRKRSESNEPNPYRPWREAIGRRESQCSWRRTRWWKERSGWKSNLGYLISLREIPDLEIGKTNTDDLSCL